MPRYPALSEIIRAMAEIDAAIPKWPIEWTPMKSGGNTETATICGKFNKVLEGHRRGYYNLQETVNLLERLWHQQSENGRKDIENLLWTTLSSEPLVPKPVGPVLSDVPRVVIRAIATFGPTAQLPSMVFGRCPSRTDLIEVWAKSMCQELSYSMLHHADRFTEGTFILAKSLCAKYTFFARSADLTGTEFPQAFTDAASDLERTIEQIEYSRFAAGLEGTEPKPGPQRSQLEEILAEVGLPIQIASAMRQAEDYLESGDPFSPKNAGDLIRASMDEAHRAVVQELEKMTGRQCSNPERDGVRRQYMRDADFITPAEEAFFSAIYTLISGEASHKLDAPKETMLVMQRTVRDYLLLLLRRLHDKRIALPPDKP